jgi:hypothetical protein
MPKISNAPSRMRSSVSVAQDTAASTTNKRIAVEKRITIKPGGQGRIRTSVARKERQIYSLLPLTTRPPVRPRRTASYLRHRPLTYLSGKTGGPSARNAHTSASRSYRAGSLCGVRPFEGLRASPSGSFLELAKGFEPPTL